MHPFVAEDGAESRSKNSLLRKNAIICDCRHIPESPTRPPRKLGLFLCRYKNLSQAYSYEITIAVNQTGGYAREKKYLQGVYVPPRIPSTTIIIALLNS